MHSKSQGCYLCGGWNNLEEHHVFGASNRKWSEKYGLKVYLCGDSCHKFGRNAVHQNSEVSLKVKREAQAKFEELIGDREKFMQIFGRNYL